MIGHGFSSVTREVHPIGNWVLSVYFVLVKWFGGGLRAHVRTPKYFGILAPPHGPRGCFECPEALMRPQSIVANVVRRPEWWFDKIYCD